MKRFYYGLIGIELAALALAPTLQGCGEATKAAAAACGLECADKGVVDGNASISGIPNVDAFFAAAVNFKTAADNLNGSIRASLDAIALSVGLKQGAAAADIKAAVEAKIKANVSGSIKVKAQPAKCSVDANVAVAAKAKCEGTVKPPKATVECSGSCEVEATADVKCDANADLVCHYTPADLNCKGTCSGTCQLESSLSCEGTCNGECTGECTVKDASGKCAGSCSGTCKGSCEMKAGASCSGKCEGECTYTPPSGGCEANARVECKAKAGLKAECSGRCDAEVEPPEVKAECEASVKAEASCNMECTPPQLQVDWQWAAGVQADVNAQAQFRAWLEGFKGNLSVLLAAKAKAKFVADAGASLGTAATGAFKGAIDKLTADADALAIIRIGCALKEAPKAGTMVKEAATTLSASVSDAASVVGAVSL